MDELVRFNPIFQIPTFIFGASLGYHFLRSDKRSHDGNLLSLAAIAGMLSIGLLSPLLPKLMLHNSLFLPFFGMLFIGLARGGYLCQFLSLPAMVLLGESSYALYILQLSIGFTFLILVNGMVSQDYLVAVHTIRTGSFANYVALLIMANAVSIIVFKFVESPLRVKLRSKIIRLLLSNRNSRFAAH